MQNKTEMLMYQTEDGQTQIEVRMENETVWLTQAEMAELFQKERTVITKHISNIFEEGELNEKSNVQILHFPNSDKPVKCYSLDVIIFVGYRVKSLRGTQFQIWATKHNFRREDKKIRCGSRQELLISRRNRYAESGGFSVP